MKICSRGCLLGWWRWWQQHCGRWSRWWQRGWLGWCSARPLLPGAVRQQSPALPGLIILLTVLTLLTLLTLLTVLTVLTVLCQVFSQRCYNAICSSVCDRLLAYIAYHNPSLPGLLTAQCSASNPCLDFASFPHSALDMSHIGDYCSRRGLLTIWSCAPTSCFLSSAVPSHICTFAHPTTRIPNSSVRHKKIRPSVTKKPGCNCSPRTVSGRSG